MKETKNVVIERLKWGCCLSYVIKEGPSEEVCFYWDLKESQMEKSSGESSQEMWQIDTRSPREGFVWQAHDKQNSKKTFVRFSSSIYPMGHSSGLGRDFSDIMEVQNPLIFKYRNNLGGLEAIGWAHEKQSFPWLVAEVRGMSSCWLWARKHKGKFCSPGEEGGL